MIYLLLFLEFFKVGLFAIGGGMATVPFLLELSEKTGWFTSMDLADMIAVSESTPGPIGINMATYVGCNTAGIFGGLVSTLGLIAPSIIIIILVHYLLMHFFDKPYVQTVLKCLRAAVIGLIVFALWQVLSICIFKDNTVNYVAVVIYVLLTAAIVFNKKIHPIVWVLSGAVIGLIFL